MENKKVVIITGASGGIGKAISKEFSRKKYNLVITARNEDKLKALALETGAEYYVGDITKTEVQDKVIQLAKTKYGGCDILINNAGILEVGTIEKINVDKIVEMVQVNVAATFRLTYSILKDLIRKNSGHIINISSVLGTKVRETAGAYAGTKHAMEALSEALRMELVNTNVKISCIEPGLVMTDLHRDWLIHPSQSMGIDQPLEPELIAKHVAYILEQPEHVRIPKLMILPKGHCI